MHAAVPFIILLDLTLQSPMGHSGHNWRIYSGAFEVHDDSSLRAFVVRFNLFYIFNGHLNALVAINIFEVNYKAFNLSSEYAAVTGSGHMSRIRILTVNAM